MALIDTGSVDNSLKPMDRGRTVWTFAFRFNWKRYYDFVHRNPALAVYDITYTNNANVLSRIDNMVAIDNCVAVDLYGQQCAGHYAGRPISSSGGYWDFITFCQMARGDSTSTRARDQAVMRRPNSARSGTNSRSPAWAIPPPITIRQVRIPTPGTNDSRAIFGALDIRSGRWVHLVRPHMAKDDFIAFLEHVLTVYADVPIVLVVDNYSSHHAGVVKDWLDTHDRLRLFYLPTYCSHLNPVEQIWLRLKDKVAANRLHGSMAMLLDTVDGFFKAMRPLFGATEERIASVTATRAAAAAGVPDLSTYYRVDAPQEQLRDLVAEQIGILE